jgi:hypothetical protein
MRWKRRLADGKDAVEKRGPKKVRPLNLAELKKKVRDLDHGRKRSRGTGRLHGAYAESISRRELNELVRQVRSDSNDPCQVEWLRLIWRGPWTVWSTGIAMSRTSRTCVPVISSHPLPVRRTLRRGDCRPSDPALQPVWTAAVHQAGQRRQPEPHFSQRGAGRTYGHPHQQPILYAQLQRGHRALSGGV